MRVCVRVCLIGTAWLARMAEHQLASATRRASTCHRPLLSPTRTWPPCCSGKPSAIGMVSTVPQILWSQDHRSACALSSQCNCVQLLKNHRSHTNRTLAPQAWRTPYIACLEGLGLWRLPTQIRVAGTPPSQTATGHA